eukprot:XP_011678775.1 PREDICTED: transcriptional regulator ATRX homolog [Strongylocentrotus purpuratus]
MQDAAIAEELQFLLGNISNEALFMRNLVRLKNSMPDVQNLQMLLKHIGKVKSDLGEFEACVKKQLHGDAHNNDFVLDGIPEGSSTGASQDEGGEKEDKVEKKKDLSAVTVTRKSRHSSAASESESSEDSDDNTKPRRRRSSRRKKKCEPEKMDSASEEEMELYGTAERREGPGEDSSNPEEVSGFDGIPGESSSGSSWDEGGEEEDKVEKKKDLSAVTVTRKSRHSSAASESESSENSDDNYTKPRRRNLSRKTEKCEPEKIDYASEVEMELYGTAEKREEPGEESSNPEEESGFDGIPGDSSSGSSWDEGGEEEDKDSASEEEMELKRHESIRGLKRKCNRAIDSDDASENVPDAQDLNNSERRQNGTGGSGGSRDDKNGGGDKKKKKRTGPYKGTKKLRPWKKRKAQKKTKRRDPNRDLYKRAKKNKNSRKKEAQKKAEEHEDWNDGERQNGTGGGGESRDDKNRGDGKKKKTKRRDPTWDLYKRAKKNKNSRKKKAPKKAKQDEDWTDAR